MDYDFYNPYLLNKLDTIDAEELMATPYAPKNFIVADMLPKSALVEFIISDFAFEIVHKSTWHINTILLFTKKK